MNFFDGFGVGIDLVKIDRFKKIPFDQNESFYRKNFSKEEIEYCLRFEEPYKHFAGKFAIKEATIKAINKKIGLLQIKTYHDDESKPKVSIINEKIDFKVSVSHDGDYAIAIVFSKIN
ncbi:MAG: holo-[acyl-carrier-protein] synthase [Chloroflexi bacterium]|nr:holo-[acyl-carrier-protein] synthase [Chloroflexota bacterium]